MYDTQGRVVAQLGIDGSKSRPPGDNSLTTFGYEIDPLFSRQQAKDLLVDVEFLQWDCDHVFSQLSDYSALFLNMATRKYPSVLTLFSLDVSQLSRVGLSSVQEVLERSILEHLHVICTPVDSQVDSISQVLDAVPWSSLKSLVFSGNSIDEWMSLWPSPIAPRLLSLQIRGNWPNVQELSHASVVLLQQLIYSSPLMELHFRNVQLQDKRDWTLIVDSMDFS